MIWLEMRMNGQLKCFPLTTVLLVGILTSIILVLGMLGSVSAMIILFSLTVTSVHVCHYTYKRSIYIIKANEIICSISAGDTLVRNYYKYNNE